MTTQPIESTKNITLPAGVVLGETLATFPADMQEPEMMAVFTFLRRARRSTTCWMASAMQFSTSRFGEDWTAAAVDQLAFAFDSIHSSQQLLSLPPQLHQISDLGPERLLVISRCKLEPDDAVKWAETAVQHNLSARALQVSIRRGSVITDEDLAEEQRPVGMLSFQAVSAECMRLRRQIDDAPVPYRAWSEKQFRAAWDAAQPAWEILEDLRRRTFGM